MNFIHFAALSGYIEAIEFALKQAPELINNEEDAFKLAYCAAESGKLNALQFVLKRFKNLEEFLHQRPQETLTQDVNMTDESLAKELSAMESRNDFPLKLALHAIDSSRSEVLEYLLDTYPHILEAHDRDGRNLLLYAAARGTKDIVAMLLKRAPQLAQERSTLGSNILHFAASTGSIETFDFLLKNLPLIFKDQSKSLFCIKTLAHERNSRGCNILHFAAKYGSTVMLHHIMNMFPALSEDSNDKRSLILSSAASGSIEKTSYFLKLYGEDMAESDENDCSILHFASSHPDLIRYLYINHPALCYKSWIKDDENLTPDDYASSNDVNPIPSQILLALIAKATDNLLEGKIEEREIQLLHVFNSKWTTILLNESNIEKTNILLRKIFSQEIPSILLDHLNKIIKLLKLNAIPTLDEPLTKELLETLVSTAINACEQPSTNILWLRMPKLLSELRCCANNIRLPKYSPLTENGILTILVIINDSSRYTCSKHHEHVTHVLLNKLLTTKTIADNRPKPTSDNNKEIIPEEFPDHFRAMSNTVNDLSLNPDIKKIIVDTFLPGFYCLITKQKEILDHYKKTPDELFTLSKDMPLHTSHIKNGDADKFKRVLDRSIIELFSSFYHCKKAGKLAGFFEKLASGYCFDSRSRHATTWAATLSEIKDFTSFVHERFKEYMGYQIVMHKKQQSELCDNATATQFICSRYENHPCIPDATYAKKGDITAAGVSKFLEDMLSYEIKNKWYYF